MFEVGLIIILVGCMLRIYLKLTARFESDSLSPRPLSERQSALRFIHNKRKLGIADANILIAAGTLLALITGIFN